jgi:hypothetical protein
MVACYAASSTDWYTSSSCWGTYTSSSFLRVLLLPLPLLSLIPPPTIFVQSPAIESKQISIDKKYVFRNRCEINKIKYYID